MDEPAFSDDEQQVENGGGEPEKCQETLSAELFTASVESEAVYTTPKVASSSSDYYFYYQGIFFRIFFVCLSFQYAEGLYITLSLCILIEKSCNVIIMVN